MSLINVSCDIILSQSNIFTCSRPPNSGSPTLRIFTVYIREKKKKISYIKKFIDIN